MAIQIARAKGAIPVAVISGDDKIDYCKQLGAKGTVNRKAVQKNGLKAMLTDEAELKARLIQNSLISWQLTVKGASLMKLRLQFAPGTDPTEVIPFTPDNVEQMTKASDMPDYVIENLNNHEAWFPLEEREESQGNSESGPNGNSAGQPAAPASKVTSPTTSKTSPSS